MLPPEVTHAHAAAAVSMSAGHELNEAGGASGRYVVACYESQEAMDRGDAPVWNEFANVVCTQGKNVMLDAALGGAGYTVTGPFIGLISSTSFTAVAAGDTMASHAGWLEAGGANTPTYTGPRPTAAWAAASAGAKSLSAPTSYTMTGPGTVNGAFMTYGTGAAATIDSTTGSLYSAGVFGVAQPVVSGNVLTVSYTTSL